MSKSRLTRWVTQRWSLLLLAVLGGSVLAYEWRNVQSAAVIKSAEAKPTVDERSGVLAEGRIAAYPGGDIMLGAELGGRIEKLHVKEQSRVKKGDLVAELDVGEQRAALYEAWARVKEADGDLDYLKAEHARSQQLLAQNVVARATYDKSEHEARLAGARKNSLLASAARLQTVLAKAKIFAPIDGTVTARFVDAGEMVSAGAPLVSIADLEHLRVEAEVGEFDAALVKLGAAAIVQAEGHDGKLWRGHVEQIPDAVVSRQMRPLDPSRPVDTRVLMVKVKLDQPVPLKLGQRVEVELSR